MVKRVVLILCLLVMAVCFATPQAVMAYDYGDSRSVTLVGKAWKALADKDVDGVLAYTNKCIELYGAKAKEMQVALKDYVQGSKDEISAYWALNDVATALFIQAEALREAGKTDEAKAVYQKLVDEFTYGQCWDNGGWFWKPAEAAKAKLAMIAGTPIIDFGDNKSATLVARAWEAYARDDVEAVNAYANKCLELYSEEAKKMQSALTEYPWETKEQVFSYWALNDVGTVLYIQGETYQKAGKTDEAKAAYKQLIESYGFAQTWDPQGFFWKPAEAAQKKIDEMTPAAPEAGLEVK